MTLPSSIEAHLTEAGFTQTELIVLRACIDGNPVSLRELAAQTKKSTGVLDQAMKKLMNRKIMTRKKVNGTPKYALASVDAVMQWVERDIAEKTAGLQRRKEDFASFIQSLEKHDAHPKVEYFEGEAGITKAFARLLEHKPEELLHFLPLDSHEEEHCFSQQRAEFNRARRKQGVPLRVLAHNTVYGKRFKERDVFEQRETKLVSKERCAIDFEKIVCGNTVACLNCNEQTAYFITFPELARSEKNLFEMVWNLKDFPSKRQEVLEKPEDKTVALRVAAYDFFCTKKSLVSIFSLAVFAVLVTGMLYANNVRLNTQRMRDQVQAIAATAVSEIDVTDVNAIRTEADILKPEWEKLINQLINIRTQNPDVRFVYILRETSDLDVFDFVADADSMDPYAIVDLNNDGVINDADALNPPGFKYDVSEIPGVRKALKKPYADPKPFTDQWGTFISGFAPIKDDQGNTVAVLGVDRIAQDVHQLTKESFHPFWIFLAVFICLLVARLYFFYQSLLTELKNCCSSYQRVLRASVFYLACSAVVTVLLYQTHVHLNTQRIRDKITSVAATAALQIDAQDVQQIHTMQDVYKPEYNQLVSLMDTIRKQNDQILYIYIIRSTSELGLYEFVVDADAIDPFTSVDTDGDGKITEADQLGLPGLPYDVTQMDALMRGEVAEPIANSQPYTDQWGSFYTAYAPIKDANGYTIAVLAVDMWASKVKEFTQSSFNSTLAFSLIFTLLLSFHLFFFERDLLLKIMYFLKKKSVLYGFLGTVIVSLLITLGMYKYTLKIMKEEMAGRLAAITSTVAPEINFVDVQNVQKNGDMGSESYQRLYKILNEIRDRNTELNLQYAYIMSPSSQEGYYEFVADADSNYFLPEQNNEDAPEVLQPGTLYDIELLVGKNETVSMLLEQTLADTSITTDEWGTYISVTSPILDSNGNGIAVIGVDMAIDEFYNRVQKKFRAPLWFMLSFTVLLLCVSSFSFIRNKW